MIKYTSNGKVMIINLIVGLIKKTLPYKISYFPELPHSKDEIKIDLILSNYATKSDLKNATSVDTSKFPKKADLAGSKSEIDKWDINKLEINPFDLSKLSDVVKK